MLRSPLRLFGLLLVVGLPPLALFGVLVSGGPSWTRNLGLGSILLLVGLFAIAWTASLTIVADRAMRRDLRQLVDEVATGPRPPGAAGEAHGRLASSLDERNRQLAELALHTRTAPITTDPVATAHQVVVAVRAVTGDATWGLAVLDSASGRLAPGLYGPSDRQPLADVHRWAAVSAGDEPDRPQLVDGPWGAFVVVELAAHEELRAILLAPWEGRGRPSSADSALFSLLGQYGATAIEHALLYARVREQADELNRLAQVQSDFLRGVTHDLQTPLTSIRALAGELRATEGIGPGAAEDLETIEHQADRLRRMVAQLLAVSRLDAGALEPRQEVLRPEPLVRRIWDALRPERPFGLELAGPPHLVVADPDRLEQVLWAVLDNAVKYSPPGSGVEAQIRLAEEADGEAVSEIAVTDHGLGMSGDTRARAFEQFYRADDARALAPDGSGIGLYAAKGLVEAMGGSIGVKSALGEGTTVTIRLPAEAASEGDESTVAVPGSADEPARARARSPS